MGVVFTIVMVVSAIMSWFFYNFILIPYNLNFLQDCYFHWPGVTHRTGGGYGAQKS